MHFIFRKCILVVLACLSFQAEQQSTELISSSSDIAAPTMPTLNMADFFKYCTELAHHHPIQHSRLCVVKKGQTKSTTAFADVFRQNKLESDHILMAGPKEISNSGKIGMIFAAPKEANIQALSYAEEAPRKHNAWSYAPIPFLLSPCVHNVIGAPATVVCAVALTLYALYGFKEKRTTTFPCEQIHLCEGENYGSFVSKVLNIKNTKPSGPTMGLWIAFGSNLEYRSPDPTNESDRQNSYPFIPPHFSKNYLP